MTPFGTLAPGCGLLAKSPPFLGAFCGLVLCAAAGNDADKVRTSRQQSRKRMFLLLTPEILGPGHTANQSAVISNLNKLARHSCVSPEGCSKEATATVE